MALDKDLKCKLLEKTSKSGNNYICAEIYITAKTKKQVFFEEAELELLKLAYGISDTPEISQKQE